MPVKLDNKNSRFTPKNQDKKEFEVKATETFNNIQSRAELAMQLTADLMKLIEDKVLPANKSSIDHSLEKEVLSRMIALTMELNNDPNEPEGVGSVGILVILMKAILKQRDKINLLSYEVSQLRDAQYVKPEQTPSV